jgi:phosphoglycolate phosphatase
LVFRTEAEVGDARYASSMRLDLSLLDAVIVDLDGTMVDTVDDFVEALGLMLDDLGLPRVCADVVASKVGKGSEHLVSSVLDHVITPAASAQLAIKKIAIDAQAAALYERAFNLYQQHYADINGRHSAVYPGVPEGLAALRQRGLRLVCLTNKPTAFAKALLAAKGLDAFFETVFGGDAFERKKPDPMPLLKTCEHLGTTPVRVLMVGDSSNDARAARSAGCPVVLVTYGYNHGEPVRAVDADGFIDSLAELG